MAIAVPRQLVEAVLLGPADDRRQIQDSPILGDVWVAYALEPDKPLELLITPHRRQSAGTVAVAIDAQMQRLPSDEADIAPLQSVIAARLYFEEVLRIVVPMTGWWHDRQIRTQIDKFRMQGAGQKQLRNIVAALVGIARRWAPDTTSESNCDLQLPALDRFIALAGLILWAGREEGPTEAATDSAASRTTDLKDHLDKMSENEIALLLTDLFDRIEEARCNSASGSSKFVFQVTRNRAAAPCIERSVPAVKADAARGLFTVNCRDIAWAVIDSGIDGRHPAFCNEENKSRVNASFDFTNIRKIVSLDNYRIFSGRDKAAKSDRLALILRDGLTRRPSRTEAARLLLALAEEARNHRSIQWEWVRPFVEIDTNSRPPGSDHGTHVAGILGACAGAPQKGEDYCDGMCPEIQLYDFRVLAAGARETEFAVIAALQFIRYLNARTDHMLIHGANLSLSIPHDVRNYACGRTPVCVESERLVDSGVVVVAAAGNLGYHRYETEQGGYEGYAVLSVTDPGNADGVITVGSTHRYSPHTYGVSFFSSRGPTGDGRMKPDLVAPGERIRAPIRNGEWGDFDGTSMAAPHVSGAAAMLMARYSELIGRPRRIKSVLCESATDLGRERSFQGHGMLDVLRALQSI